MDGASTGHGGDSMIVKMAAYWLLALALVVGWEYFKKRSLKNDTLRKRVRLISNVFSWAIGLLAICGIVYGVSMFAQLDS